MPPHPPPQYSPLDITKGFVDAVTIWSDFLRGKRTKSEWGVYGAYSFLDSIGFDIPKQPISVDDLKRLEVLAEAAEKVRGNKMGTTTRDLNQMKKKMRNTTDTLSKYFEANCNVAFSVDLDASGVIENACNSIDTAVGVAQSEYDTVDGLLDQYDTTQNDPKINNYEQIGDALDNKNVSQEELDIVGESSIDRDYWTPPEPAYFDRTFGAMPE